MNLLASLFGSTIGRKALMAITGAIIFGFVIGHMAGNLLIFAGPDAINSYAATLKSTAPLLWGTRLTLLAAIPLHVWSAVTLTRDARKARPVGYKKLAAQTTTYAARTMRYGGVILALFIVFHLLQYTVLVVDPSYKTLVDAEGRHDVYAMVMAGFSNPVTVVAYLLAMGSLGLHLSHGVWSLMQSLGLNHPKYNALRKQVAVAFAVLLVVGFSAVPVAVLTGIIS